MGSPRAVKQSLPSRAGLTTVVKACSEGRYYGKEPPEARDAAPHEVRLGCKRRGHRALLQLSPTPHFSIFLFFCLHAFPFIHETKGENQLHVIFILPNEVVNRHFGGGGGGVSLVVVVAFLDTSENQS